MTSWLLAWTACIALVAMLQSVQVARRQGLHREFSPRSPTSVLGFSVGLALMLGVAAIRSQSWPADSVLSDVYIILSNVEYHLYIYVTSILTAASVVGPTSTRRPPEASTPPAL